MFNRIGSVGTQNVRRPSSKSLIPKYTTKPLKQGKENVMV